MSPIRSLDEIRVPVDGVDLRLRHILYPQPESRSMYYPDCCFLNVFLTTDACLPRARYVELDNFEVIGEQFFVPSGHEIHFRTGMTDRRALQFRFPREQFSALDLLWDPSMLNRSLSFRSRRIQDACGRMVQEMTEPGFASGLLLNAMATMVAVEVVRHFRDLDGGSARGGLAGWRLRLIRERAWDGDGEPALDELAALVGMSVRNLTRAFKQETGQTVGSYVTEVLILRAQQMLCQDDLSITAIGRKLGFAHGSAFSLAFRKATGRTPRDYRARARPS